MMKPRSVSRLPTASIDVARAGRGLGGVVGRDRAAQRDAAVLLQRADRGLEVLAADVVEVDVDAVRRGRAQLLARPGRRGSRTRRRSRARRAGRRPSPASRRCRSPCGRAASRSVPRASRPRPRRRTRTRRRRRAARRCRAGRRTRSARACRARRGTRTAGASDASTVLRVPGAARPRTRASRAGAGRRRPRAKPVGARGDDLADRAAVHRLAELERRRRRTCASFMRPRMYGSTDMNVLRTTISPSRRVADFDLSELEVGRLRLPVRARSEPDLSAGHHGR